jgi:hypothetical protein
VRAVCEFTSSPLTRVFTCAQCWHKNCCSILPATLLVHANPPTTMSHHHNLDVDKDAVFSTTVTGMGSRLEEKGVPAADHTPPTALASAKSPGVARIEALNAHTSFINRCCIFFGIFLIAYAYGLDGTLRYTYQPYATAGFQQHSTLATISKFSCIC